MVPLTRSEPAQVLVGGVGEDVDQGGADGDDVERCGALGVGPVAASFTARQAYSPYPASGPRPRAGRR